MSPSEPIRKRRVPGSIVVTLFGATSRGFVADIHPPSTAPGAGLVAVNDALAMALPACPLLLCMACQTLFVTLVNGSRWLPVRLPEWLLGWLLGGCIEGFGLVVSSYIVQAGAHAKETCFILQALL